MSCPSDRRATVQRPQTIRKAFLLSTSTASRTVWSFQVAVQRGLRVARAFWTWEFQTRWHWPDTFTLLSHKVIIAITIHSNLDCYWIIPHAKTFMFLVH